MMKLRNIKLKTPSKKVVISVSLVLIVFLTSFIYYNLTRPTKLNKIYAHIINKGAPANKYFDDEVFYQVVVDAYNYKNNTNLPYTTNLTDEQLKTITYINYSGEGKNDNEKIRSTNGIEKLISLKDLRIYYSNISSINLSLNKSLEILSLTYNNLEDIDLSENDALMSLYLQHNKLDNIDVSHNISIEKLYITSQNNLSTIDLSKNVALKFLGLSGNELNTIDLSKNILLEDLDIENNNLSSVDLSNNTELRDVRLRGNNLSTIDLSKNILLEDLDIENNNLSNIDLSKNVNLEYLYLSANNIESINLNKNINLKYFYMDSNNLTTIDLSNNVKLRGLGLSYNNISTIDLSNNVELENMYINDNNLTVIVYLMPNKEYTYDKIILPDTLYSKLQNNYPNIIDFTDYTATALRTGFASINYFGEKNIIHVYNITSTKYQINEEDKYIYTKTDIDSDTILSNLVLDNIKGRIENNKLILYKGDTIVDEYKIISISSTDYDLNKGNALVINNKFDTSKIDVTNGTVEVSDNKLNIKYNDEVIDTIDIASISSDKYNLTNNYLYLLNEELDLNEINTVNCSVKVEDGKLIVYKDEYILESIDIVSISYSSSDYDLSKEYIYLGTDNFDSNKIESTNLTFEIKDNILYLKYQDDIFKQYKLIKISSTKYDLNKEYIYVGNNALNTSDINVTNGKVEVSDNKLNIKYQDKILDSYKISSISSNKYNLSKDNIRLRKDEEFNIDNISTINCEKEYSDDKLYIKYGEDILKVYTISNRAPGDITGDDEIDLRDVIKLFRHYRKKAIIEDEETLAICDITGDEEIDLRDVIKLFRYYRGKIPSLD